MSGTKLRLTVGHVGAGLRSDDWRMAEEHDRVMIDHISNLVFAPTKGAAENAVRDYVKGKVHVTSSTVLDAAQRGIALVKEHSTILEDLNVEPGERVVFKAHGEENVEGRDVLADPLAIIERTVAETALDVVY
jgi:UDP-N-acetylglucosamine 2-epimerase (non-hydrolysing)